MPPLPTRLMAGLAILKFTFDLSDEELCVWWIENLEGSVRSRGTTVDMALNATTLKPN